MRNNPTARRDAIAVIVNFANRNWSDILKAVFDLRHNAETGDEAILLPLLEHEDAYVVASTLYSLHEVYEQHEPIAPVIRRLAWGDSRDSDEMPIQCMAITLLSNIGKSDLTARQQLVEIAENTTLAKVPREHAWQCLAELYGVEWLANYTEELITSPGSNESELIRQRIRQAMSQRQNR